MIWVMIFLGNLLSILIKMNSDLDSESETNTFSFFKKWFKNPKNFLFVLIGIIASLSIVLTVDFTQISNFMYEHISFKAPEVLAFFSGLCGQIIVNKAIDLILRKFFKK
jgi:hypothetical protein